MSIYFRAWFVCFQGRPCGKPPGRAFFQWNTYPKMLHETTVPSLSDLSAPILLQRLQQSCQRLLLYTYRHLLHHAVYKTLLNDHVIIAVSSPRYSFDDLPSFSVSYLELDCKGLSLISSGRNFRLLENFYLIFPCSTNQRSSVMCLKEMVQI